MKEKLLTLWWFLKRPEMHIQLWQLFLRRAILKNDRLKEAESIKWCRENAISERQATQLLFPGQMFNKFNDMFSEIVLNAKQKVKNISVEMGGAGALDLIYNIAKNSKSSKILETGVSYGWSSLAFLMAICENKGNLFSIDMPYPKMGNEEFVGLVVPDELRHNWILLKVPDRIGIPRAIKQITAGFDLIHYDSDKSYSGRKWAYPILWNSLKGGGYFISDDIQDNIAFKEFCNTRDLKPIIVESMRKYVGIVKK